MTAKVSFSGPSPLFQVRTLERLVAGHPSSVAETQEPPAIFNLLVGWFPTLHISAQELFSFRRLFSTFKHTLRCRVFFVLPSLPFLYSIRWRRRSFEYSDTTNNSHFSFFARTYFTIWSESGLSFLYSGPRGPTLSG
jgi:hypothetical protein